MKVALLFPGFSSQYVGMGKEFYDEYRVVQEYFEEAANCADVNFVKLCFASSEVELGKMANAYMSIFVVSTSIVAALRHEGINPVVVAGYATGYYSALHAAGSITLPDGLYLLNKLSVFYEELLQECDVRMVRIVGVQKSLLESLCVSASHGENKVSIAFECASDEYIISGHTFAVGHLIELLKKGDDTVVVEDVPIELGLHSDIMMPVAKNLKIYLEKVDFKDIDIPLIASADGRIIMDGREIKELTVQDIILPTQWSTVMHNLQECELIIQVGPGSQLSELLKRVYPENRTCAINKKSDIDKLKYMIPTRTMEI